MIKITASILSFLLAFPAFAQELCRAPYALQHENFRYDEYRESMQGVERYLVAFLWNTFGRSTVNLQKELPRPEVSGVELILLNAVCAKPQYGPKGRCGKYEIFAGLTIPKIDKLIRQRDPELRARVQGEAQIACSSVVAIMPAGKKRYLNPLLEWTGSAEAWRILAEEWVAPNCPGWGLVWNPMGEKPGAPLGAAVLSEGHGPAPRFADSRCIANPDGSIPEDGDYEGYLRKYRQLCAYACAWGPNDNCIPHGGGFVDPRKRTCREIKDFKVLGAAMRAAQGNLEVAPPWSASDDLSSAQCASQNPVADGDGGFVWKQSHVPGYHGVILFPAKFGKFSQVQILAAGKRVGSVEHAAGPGFPDQSAGNRLRPIWRTSVDLKKYPFNVVVRGTLRQPVKNQKGKVILPKGVHCWRLSNPRLRND